ncbi:MULTISPECIES: AraC family transcriptional regulator [unclassified Plantactinospora]|uniref:helix-turn-helix transcriptional regulator n=1 Tax=unclassified Plantactinospora TaxID=2631981 RepID=UPI000D15B003|nr:MULTISPECIES: AraC family transcriptional regulator [unclassified Plantactinospora]AVT33521.1 AraC family transcriptional regulator [Plantactinospora sp. BC1]AVT38960.1 AraC family transcriptional regulator [Plantactinospora sp. BB1]
MSDSHDAMPGFRDAFAADGRLQARWRWLGCPDGMGLYEVRCHNTRRGWEPARPSGHFTVHLARSGGYLRRLNGRERFVDPTSALFLKPSDDLTISHPLGCGDSYTVIEVDPELLVGWADGERWLTGAGWEGRLRADLDLEHRALVADSLRGTDRFELTERTHRLLGRLLAAGPDRPGEELDRAVRRRPGTLAAHRRLTDRVREVVSGGGYALGLTELARQVHCSPHHLSRVFQWTTGQSLTAYRNQLRTRAVLTALAAGEVASLRGLAAEYGFADQAHLTRTLRQQLGHSPTQLRRLLATTSGPARR